MSRKSLIEIQIELNRTNRQSLDCTCHSDWNVFVTIQWIIFEVAKERDATNRSRVSTLANLLSSLFRCRRTKCQKEFFLSLLCVVACGLTTSTRVLWWNFPSNLTETTAPPTHHYPPIATVSSLASAESSEPTRGIVSNLILWNWDEKLLCRFSRGKSFVSFTSVALTRENVWVLRWMDASQERGSQLETRLSEIQRNFCVRHESKLFTDRRLARNKVNKSDSNRHQLVRIESVRQS